MQKTSNCK